MPKPDSLTDNELGFVPDGIDAAPVTANTPPPVSETQNLGQKLLNSKIPAAAGGLAGAAAASPLIPEFAAAGSIFGPPGALIGGAIPPIAGAIVGGAGLEAWRQNIARLVGEHAPESSIDALNKIGESGLDQGIQEATGRMFLGTARAGSKALLATALKTVPEVAQTAIREGITATKGGLVKLTGRWAAITKAERGMATRAGISGIRVPATNIANDAYDDVQRQIRGAEPALHRKLQSLYDDYIKRGDMTPTAVLNSRKWSDRVAASQYALREGGKRGAAGLREMWSEAVGNATRQHLRTAVPAINNPDEYLRLAGSRTLPSEITRLKSVVEPIVKRAPSGTRKFLERGIPLATGAGIGAYLSPGDRFKGSMTGAAMAAGGAASVTPQALSRIGIAGARNPLLTHMLLNLPRIVSTFNDAPAEATAQ